MKPTGALASQRQISHRQGPLAAPAAARSPLPPLLARPRLCAPRATPFGGGDAPNRDPPPQQQQQQQAAVKPPPVSPPSSTTEDEEEARVLDPFAPLAVFAPSAVRRHADKHVVFASGYFAWVVLGACVAHALPGSPELKLLHQSAPTTNNKPQTTVPPATLESPLTDVLRCPDLRHLPALAPRPNPLLRLVDHGCVFDDDRSVWFRFVWFVWVGLVGAAVG
jgi:hypothetical protein